MIPQAPAVKYIGAASGPYGLLQPFHAFADAQSAARWAYQCAEDPELPERFVWPVQAIELGGPLLGAQIPAKYELTPVVEEGPES